jgi:hypothetical protein
VARKTDSAKRAEMRPRFAVDDSASVTRFDQMRDGEKFLGQPGCFALIEVPTLLARILRAR